MKFAGFGKWGRGIFVRIQSAILLMGHPNLSPPAFDALKAVLTHCVGCGPASQNRDGHADFRAHLAGRVAHAVMVNRVRGAKLKAIFERIVWD